MPVRFGVPIAELIRRQATAAIRQLTGGVRPTHVARGARGTVWRWIRTGSSGRADHDGRGPRAGGRPR